MANILLGIVVALLVAWSLPDLVRWRDWSWLHRVTQHKIPLPLVVAAFFLTCFALVQMLGHGIAGFLFGTVVLYLCLGPRDLEADVRGVLGLVDDGQAGSALQNLHQDTHTAMHADWAALVFAAGLSRWFGVIFWFALLGAPGALAYRMVQQLARSDSFTEVSGAQRGEMEHLAQLLDWLPARLLALGAALLSSLEPVMVRWRAHLAAVNLRWWSLDDGFLAVVAAAATGDDELVAPRRMQRALQLLRRVLISWLALLAVLVIIG